MNRYIWLLALNVLMLVAGQCVWKLGLQQMEEFSVINLIKSWYIWFGCLLYGIATILWLKVLSIAPLSVAYPMQSMAYVLGIGVAVFIFNECLTVLKMVGAILILLGVACISYR